MDTFKPRMSKKGMWLLFSACAAPLHIWAIILFLRDFSWVAERTNVWDSLGVGSYGLLIILVESILIFVISLVVALILPKRWTQTKRVAVVGGGTFLIALWAIIGQLYFLLEIHLPPSLIRLVGMNAHPLRMLYGGMLFLVSATILIPALFTIRSDQIQKRITDFIDRTTPLTSLYLFLDFISLILIVVRNL